MPHGVVFTNRRCDQVLLREDVVMTKHASFVAAFLLATTLSGQETNQTLSAKDDVQPVSFPEVFCGLWIESGTAPETVSRYVEIKPFTPEPFSSVRVDKSSYSVTLFNADGKDSTAQFRFRPAQSVLYLRKSVGKAVQVHTLEYDTNQSVMNYSIKSREGVKSELKSYRWTPLSDEAKVSVLQRFEDGREKMVLEQKRLRQQRLALRAEIQAKDEARDQTAKDFPMFEKLHYGYSDPITDRLDPRFTFPKLTYRRRFLISPTSSAADAAFSGDVSRVNVLLRRPPFAVEIRHERNPYYDPRAQRDLMKKILED